MNQPLLFTIFAGGYWFCMVFFPIGAAEPKEFLSIVGSWSGKAAQEETARDYTLKTALPLEVVGQNNKRIFEWLADKRIDVGLWSPEANLPLEDAIAQHFPDRQLQPEVFSVGQFAVYIVVNRANPTQRLTYAQLRGIYDGSISNWSKVGNGNGKVRLIGEGERNPRGPPIFRMPRMKLHLSSFPSSLKRLKRKQHGRKGL